MNRIFIFICTYLLMLSTCFADMHLYIQHKPQTEILNDGKMHIIFCGTGDPEIAMQSIRRPSCLAVIADKQFLIFDSGEGSSQNLGALGLPIQEIKNLFVTHLHSDHIAGIGYLNNVSWLSGRNSPLTVFGPYGIRTVVKSLNDMYRFDGLFRAINARGGFDVINSQMKAREIKVTEKGIQKPIFKTDQLAVTPFLVDHNPVYPALGYLIQYKGCKIVLSGDTNVAQNLIDVADKADVLINEAFSHHLGQEIVKSLKERSGPQKGLEFFNQIVSYHSDTLELAKMAAKDHVKNLIITHLVPAIPTTAEAKAAFIKGMSELYSGPITVVDDRDELIIVSDGGNCKVQYHPAKQAEIELIRTIQ